jgi:hypothetical protein
MNRSTYEWLATLRVSAGNLVKKHDIAMSLADGNGWTLSGSTWIDDVGEVGLECPPDPDFELCIVYVPVPSRAGWLKLVLASFDLRDEDVLQLPGQV